MLHEVTYIAHHGVLVAQHVLAASPSPSPAPKSESGANYAGLAALIAAIAGLVSAVGAIILGLRKRDGGSNSAAADKAIEYLIKQNKELLKKQQGS